jgi:hypothetical protein
MTALVRKYGLFYLGHTVTFFFLCAYSLAANAPNYPYLPAMFFPLYLSSAVAMSERETGDPLLGVLPITPVEIMRVKFLLAFVFVVIGWLNMSLFTALQGLPPHMTENVMKLNTLGSIYTLLLAGAFQLGIRFFGWSTFHKVIILLAIVSGVFSILFFIGIAERGNYNPDLFPLVPLLESLPAVLVGVLAAGAGFVHYYLLQKGPWNTKRSSF